MHKEKPKINCPVFQKQEQIISAITDRINSAKAVEEKAKFAEELRKEVNVLFFCSDYAKERLDCKNCCVIANLRRKTADLIIKTKKLI